eukprot:gene62055-84871_t
MSIDFLRPNGWPGSVELVPARGPRLSPDNISIKTSAISAGKLKLRIKGFGFIQPDNGGPDVFVHISAVERAGMSTLNEGQKISYEVLADRRTGKSAAGNLRAA